MLLHTEKGEKIFKQVKNDMQCSAIDVEKAIAGNTLYNHSVERPSERERFFADLKDLQWDVLYDKYNASTKHGILNTIKDTISSTAVWSFYRKMRYHKQQKQDETNCFQYGMMIRLRE